MAAAILTFTGALAQNVDDALRYSQIFYYGTARFMSMSGAFTALGRSFVAQPESGRNGVFRSSEVTLTPQLIHSKTSAIFNGIHG